MADLRSDLSKRSRIYLASSTEPYRAGKSCLSSSFRVFVVACFAARLKHVDVGVVEWTEDAREPTAGLQGSMGRIGYWVWDVTRRGHSAMQDNADPAL